MSSSRLTSCTIYVTTFHPCTKLKGFIRLMYFKSSDQVVLHCLRTSQTKLPVMPKPPAIAKNY